MAEVPKQFLSPPPNQIDLSPAGRQYLQQIADNAGGASPNATYVVETTEPSLPNSYVLTAGTNITLTPGVGILTVAASGGGSSNYLFTAIGGGK